MKTKRKYYYLFALIIIVIISYLFIPINPVGVYTAKYNVNTIDSLIIRKDGYYEQIIYRSTDKKLLYRNTSKWKYDNGRIILYNLYENDDREFKDDYDFNCALEILDVTLERSFGRVVFRYENGKYLYYKLWF